MTVSIAQIISLHKGGTRYQLRLPLHVSLRLPLHVNLYLPFGKLQRIFIYGRIKAVIIKHVIYGLVSHMAM